MTPSEDMSKFTNTIANPANSLTALNLPGPLGQLQSVWKVIDEAYNVWIVCNDDAWEREQDILILGLQFYRKVTINPFIPKTKEMHASRVWDTLMMGFMG